MAGGNGGKLARSQHGHMKYILKKKKKLKYSSLTLVTAAGRSSVRDL